MPALHVIETSDVLRIGLKGPQAAAWLAQQGLPLPEPWHWLVHEEMQLSRLGQSEFVLQAELTTTGLTHTGLPALCTQLQHAGPGVYPVARYDAGWLMFGDSLPAVMAELCMLDWQTETATQRLCMTQLAGINVTLLQKSSEGQAGIQLWCDGSYRDYLHQQLLQRVAQV